MQHPRIVAAEFEFGDRRRAVHEVDAPALAVALNVETAHAVAGNAIEIVLTSRKRQANQPDQFLAAAGEVLAQAEEPQSVFAERAEFDPQRPAVGPTRQVAFESTTFVFAIARRITPK